MNTPTLDTIGQRVAYARKEADMTQPQLAAEVARLSKGKLTQQAISKIERDGSELPTILVYIARATNFSSWWLQTGDGPPKAIELSAQEFEVIQAIRRHQRDNEAKGKGMAGGNKARTRHQPLQRSYR